MCLLFKMLEGVWGKRYKHIYDDRTLLWAQLSLWFGLLNNCLLNNNVIAF